MRANIPYRVYCVKCFIAVLILLPDIMETNSNFKKIINRLSRAEGQIRALRETIEKNKTTDCKHFVTQIRAARSALKSVNEQIVIDHIKECQILQPKERDEKIAEALKIISTD